MLLEGFERFGRREAHRRAELTIPRANESAVG